LLIEGNSNQFFSEENKMRKNNENTLQETQTAFALAVVLLNFLIFAVVIGLFWSLQILLSPNSPLSAALSETMWR
jgi:hypothetical protein